MVGLRVLSKAGNPFSSYQLSFCPLRGGQQCPGGQRLSLTLARLEALRGTQFFQKGSLASVPVLNSCFSISSSELQSLPSSSLLQLLQVQACLRGSLLQTLPLLTHSNQRI